MTALLLAGWIACGILAYGFAFAYFQRSHKCFAWKHRHEDRGFATFLCLVGPMGLLVVLFSGGYAKGWTLSGVSAEESWNDYHRRWSILTKQDWEDA